MIKVHSINSERIARLECDRCHATFPFFVVLEHHELPTAAQRTTLRDLAQHGRWFHILPTPPQPERDLCPGCYTMPPEG